MRQAAAAILLSVLAAACGGGGEPGSSPILTGTSPSPPTSATPASTATTSPTTSQSADLSPTIAPTLQLPADAPTTFAEARTPQQFAQADYAELAPPGSTVTSAAVLATPDAPFDQIAFVWRRGEDPFAVQLGLVVWRHFAEAPVWRAILAFTDRPAKGALGIILESGDVTGDEIDDLLTFELFGGSGACGTWRVTGSFPDGALEIFRRRTCDAELRVALGGLQLREAIYEPGDAHCCPNAFRITRLEWDGEAFVEISREVRENPS